MASYTNILIFIALYFITLTLDPALCYDRYYGNYLSHNNHMNNSPSPSPEPMPIDQGNSFNVKEFGAKGDGETDDTKAFLAAFEAACKVHGGVLYVPSQCGFVLQPLIFSGNSCQPNIVFQVDGEVIAPQEKPLFKENKDSQWILFMGFTNGITIEGEGVFEGHGEVWWNKEKGFRTAYRPYALRIAESTNVTVRGITIQNSPRMHLYIDHCQYIEIGNLKISSPKESPNTDGIHLTGSQHADVYNSIVACGDDCISIQSGTSDVYVRNVTCGPGHGYSIGGLGPPQKRYANVSDVIITECTARDSQTGVRIKTWQGGYGTVRNITFSNITMSDVEKPIVIDQEYCGGDKEGCDKDHSTKAVAISDVRYQGISGTYTNYSVSLVCSAYEPCRDLKLETIYLRPSPSLSSSSRHRSDPYCVNAYGKVYTETMPLLDGCVIDEQSVTKPPSMAPTYDIYDDDDVDYTMWALN